MNKIAKILSVVLSASIALTVAVVTLVSALAADAPVFSVNKVSETDTTYVVSVNLESGKFNNATFEIKTSAKLTGCTKIAKGATFATICNEEENVLSMTNKDTAMATITSISELSTKGDYFVFTFAKADGAKVGADDITLTEKDIGAKIENKLPVIVVTTKAPATTTEAAKTTTEAAKTTTEAAKTTTEAAKTTTEAAKTTTATVETTTKKVAETTTAAVKTTAATVETTAVVEDGTTAEAVVVNPNTGDSATASAAIVALLAISGAAVVALRKKED